MTFQIKKATYDNIHRVHQYMSTIFALQLNGLSIRPDGFSLEETKQYLPESITSKEKLCALAVSDMQITGQLSFSRYTKKEYRHGGKFGMSVHPDHWRQGIGSSLLAFLDDWARETGITKLELEVWSNNRSAIRLYEKNGYFHEGCRKGSIITRSQTIDLLLMGKSIR